MGRDKLMKLSFEDLCRYVCEVNRENFTDEAISSNKRKYSLYEKYAAYLWMAYEVNDLQLPNRWISKEIIFPNDQDSLNIGVLSVLTDFCIDVKDQDKLFDYYGLAEIENFYRTDELLEIVQLYVVVEGWFKFKELTRTENSYAALYRMLKVREEAFPDVIGIRNKYQLNIARFITNDHDESISVSKQIAIVLTRIVYTYALRLFPQCVFPLVIRMGTIHELPFDIIMEILMILNVHLKFYGAYLYTEAGDNLNNDMLMKALTIVETRFNMPEYRDYTDEDVKELVNSIIDFKFK